MNTYKSFYKTVQGGEDSVFGTTDSEINVYIK